MKENRRQDRRIGANGKVLRLARKDNRVGVANTTCKNAAEHDILRTRECC
jgi:hypothetical protein